MHPDKMSRLAGVIPSHRIAITAAASLSAPFPWPQKILVGIIGASFVRRFYRRHELAIVRLSGLLFMGFAVQAIWHAAPGLLGVRKP